jgi:hypothetical protein
MISRSDRLKSRLEQLNRGREKTYKSQDRWVRDVAGHSRPVRRTVMLPPSENLALTEWCRTTANELGLTRITRQDVLHMLVARLLSDPALTGQLRADLAAHQAGR